MGLLNTLKAAAGKRAAQRLHTHPVACLEPALRSTYWNCLAVAAPHTRALTDAEAHAVFALASSLGLVTDDSPPPQLTVATESSASSLLADFDTLRELGLATLYQFDLASLQTANGPVASDAHEIALVTADLLELEPTVLTVIQEFAHALRTRDEAILIRCVPALARDDLFATCLRELLQPHFPYAGVLDFRWIDHGDGTATDSITGIMWARYVIGESWVDGKAEGTPHDVMLNPDPRPLLLRAINQERTISGFSDWRLAHKNDYQSLLSADATTCVHGTKNWSKLDVSVAARMCYLHAHAIFGQRLYEQISVCDIAKNYDPIVMRHPKNGSQTTHWVAHLCRGYPQYQAITLYAEHPLSHSTDELRSCFIAALGQTVPINQSVSGAERKRFMMISESLRIDPSEAQEQLNERAQTTEEGLLALRQMMLEHGLQAILVLDAYLVAGLDENGQEERSITRAVTSQFLDNKSIRKFAHAALSGDREAMAHLKADLPDDPYLLQAAGLLLEGCAVRN